MTTDDDFLKKLSKSLDQLVRLEIYKILESEPWINKSNGEKIYFLYRMNFSNEAISKLIGTTTGTVKKEISLRKKS